MSISSIDSYNNAVTDCFGFLKSAKNVQDAYLRAIPIEDQGYLLPVCEMHMEDESLIRALTAWRNANVVAYPTQFVATVESTRAWMKDRLLAVNDRMLFLVVTTSGQMVGHIGFNGCFNDLQQFEIDNVVRGVSCIAKGLMAAAMEALIQWARKQLPVNGFFLRVMDDNAHAVAFYQKNGFVNTRKIPLIDEVRGDTRIWHETEDGQIAVKHFLRMDYAPTSHAGKKLILTAGPSISARETTYAFDAARNGWNSSWSKYLTSFENKFAEYLDVKYAIATSSCTGALQIALMALDIGPGDEVIVPDLTWVATANAVRYVGATPIFADVELDTWNIDSASIERLITPRTKAIMPVHMYGHPARMDKVMQLAQKYGLKVVEDAAPAIGAEWQNKRCGSFGHFGAFSFQGAKLMVTGEGGMLVTDDHALYERALKIWDQGRNPTKAFWIDTDGVKFKMSNVQAAIGLGQLERVDELIEMKRRVFSWYQEGLEDQPNITLNREVKGARSIYWMSSLRLDESIKVPRDDLIKQLKALNVDSRPVFPSISQYPIWTTRQDPQPTAMRVGRQAINLPSGVCLTRDEVMYVTKAIRKLLTSA